MCLLFVSFVGCSPPTKCKDTDTPEQCTRVLFIGNSYTFVNDLPATFAKLAASGGHLVEVGMVAQGGWSLADHLKSAETIDQITSSKWDFVVLQEQSQMPASSEARTRSMYASARALVRRIRASGASPLLFMTWAHRDGWPEQGMQDYASMQSQINTGYLVLARDLGIPVAPVGYAWSLVQTQNPGLELWQQDGSHPAEQGTYLAACVFYTVLFQETPQGLNYRAGLSKEIAQSLQKFASDAVLGNPAQWNLP